MVQVGWIWACTPSVPALKRQRQRIEDLSRNYRIKIHSETVSKKVKKKKGRDKFSTASSVFLTIYSSSFTPLGASWRPCSCWYLSLDSPEGLKSQASCDSLPYPCLLLAAVLEEIPTPFPFSPSTLCGLISPTRM